MPSRAVSERGSLLCSALCLSMHPSHVAATLLLLWQGSWGCPSSSMAYWSGCLVPALPRHQRLLQRCPSFLLPSSDPLLPRLPRRPLPPQLPPRRSRSSLLPLALPRRVLTPLLPPHLTSCCRRTPQLREAVASRSPCLSHHASAVLAP